MGIKLQPNDNSYFKMMYNYSDARFKEYIDTIRGADGFDLINYANNRIPYAPSHTFFHRL